MKLLSSAFFNNSPIPDKFTCEGKNVSPPLTISKVPNGASSLLLIFSDQDSSIKKPFFHWIVFNIIPQDQDIPEDKVPIGGVELTNDFGQMGYGGPCPHSGIHRYFFELYALNETFSIADINSLGDILKNLDKKILTSVQLKGTYSKKVTNGK